LSIIIVGIGDADFTAMEQLDSDEFELVDGRGTQAKRDIVQFVQLSEFKDRMMEGGDSSKLAEAVLGEVPDQLVGYMIENGIKIGDALGDKDEKASANDSDDD
jgi:hypothetical protein